MRAVQDRHENQIHLWAFGSALGVVADDTVYDDIVALARDASLGRAREVLVLDGLGRMKNPDATLVLIELADDPTIDSHVVMALARRRDPRAVAVLRRFADDRRAWVRNAANKGLRRLDSGQTPGDGRN